MTVTLQATDSLTAGQTGVSHSIALLDRAEGWRPLPPSPAVLGVLPEVADSLASHVDVSFPRSPHEALSNREYEVMCLIAQGKSVSDIADQLALSVKTISTYRSRILEKLGLRHNAEISRYALRHGLVE